MLIRWEMVPCALLRRSVLTTAAILVSNDCPPSKCNFRRCCNNYGECFCHIGWKPPMCRSRGPGGSIPDGPASSGFGQTGSVKTSQKPLQYLRLIFGCIYVFMEKAMAPHSSTLAWRIPWTEEPGRLQSMGSLRVGQDWATSLSLFTFMPWRRKWQPTLVFVPGESQGRGSLVGCRLWGRTESDTTDAT